MASTIHSFILLVLIGTAIAIVVLSAMTVKNVSSGGRSRPQARRRYPFSARKSEKYARREQQWKQIDSAQRQKRLEGHIGEIVNYHANRISRRTRRKIRRGGRGANKAMAKVRDINNERDTEVRLFLKRLSHGGKASGSVHPGTGETKHGIGRAGHGTRGHDLIVNPKKDRR